MRKQLEDFLNGDAWRLWRIMAEFVEGFEELSNVAPAVTIFGSSRTKENMECYNLAYNLGKTLAREGYTIITGAGGGVMEAANKGAFEEGGESIGLNIILPQQQKANKYITNLLEFKHFFVRKVMFLKYASAVVFVPGGYGTMDELFETLTLVQTERIPPLPIYALGKSHWEGLFEWMTVNMFEKDYILKKDMEIFKITDDIEEIKNGINQFVVKNQHKS